MNGTQSQVEERVWSEAEAKAFQKKHKVYLDAANDVNGFIEFLRDQHNIEAKDGWQLGEGCFIRQRPDPVTIPGMPPPKVKGKTQRPLPSPEPVAAGVNGADIPSEEL